MIYDRCLKKRIPGIFGSAGLLHDIGKVILHIFFQQSYQETLKDARKQEVTLADLEMEKYKVTHQDLGAYLLNWWELPFAYVEAAMFHHRPFDSRIINHELVGVIHLADYYSLKMMAPDGTKNDLNLKVFDMLEIKQEDVEAIVESLK